MARTPLRRLAVPAACCALVLAALAYGIGDAQRSARAELDARWADRARTTAGMVDSMLAGTARQAVPTLQQRYGTDVPRRALRRDARRGGLAYAAVTDEDGELIGATAAAPSGVAARAAAALTDARAGREAYRLTGVLDFAGRPVLEWVVPYPSGGGLRAHVSGIPAEGLAAFFDDTLTHTRAARALLVDPVGRVVGDSTGTRAAGAPLDIPALTRAGEDTAVVQSPVGRSPLRVVLLQPRSGLYPGFDGVGRWLPWLAVALSAAAMLAGLVLLARLAGSHAALRRSEERYALAFRGARDGLWDWDIATGRVHYSERCAELLGIEPAVLGDRIEGWLERVHPDDRADFEATLSAHPAELDHEHRLRGGDGRWVWVRVRGTALHDAQGRPYRMAGSMRDTTARRHAVDRLEHRANHDPLTGLANRAHFFDALERAIDRATRGETEPCAVVFLDLDGFKAVNDRHGHHTGDRVLVAAARRLEAHVRPGDLVGRLGGDELAILVGRVQDAAEAEQLAGRLADALGVPYEVDGVRIRVGASAGVAVAGPGDHAEQLVRLADAAMYRAKLAA